VKEEQLPLSIIQHSTDSEKPFIIFQNLCQDVVRSFYKKNPTGFFVASYKIKDPKTKKVLIETTSESNIVADLTENDYPIGEMIAGFISLSLEKLVEYPTNSIIIMNIHNEKLDPYLEFPVATIFVSKKPFILSKLV